MGVQSFVPEKDNIGLYLEANRRFQEVRCAFVRDSILFEILSELSFSECADEILNSDFEVRSI